MEQDMVGDMLAKRRDRAIATILRVKETDCDKFLPVEAQRRLRKVVLDEVNDFFALCTDLMLSMEGNGIMNELYLKKIEAMHQDMRRLMQSNGVSAQ